MKKLPALLICLYVCMCFPAHAQTDNTFYVKNFQGSTVAQKTVQAQAACEANPAVPCIIVFDPTLATYSQGTMPAKCSQCVWKDYRTLGGDTAVEAINFSTKAPSVYVTYPDFALGQPIASVSVTNGACTSNPTVSIPSPAFSIDGSQASAAASCVNGQTVVSVTFAGGGYSSTQVPTISGGGTSGATASLVLLGTAQAADPTGSFDSTAPIMNALDYAAAQGALTLSTPQVRIPAGKYLLDEELTIPEGINLTCDGRNATVLLENNAYAGVTVAGNQNSYSAGFEAFGGTSHCQIATDLGSAYKADQLQVFAPGYNLSDVLIANGGGIGLDVQAERGNFTNIKIDQVRQPVILGGPTAANETKWSGIDINGGGEAGDGTYYGANAPGGVYPSPNWKQGATIVSAIGNGSTATFVIQCNSACGEGSGIAPIGQGAWFKISGISDVTGLNGIWQAQTITPNQPSSGQFTIVTAPLQTGTYTAPQTVEQFTLDANQMPLLMNASNVSVTGTATGLSSATFQPVIWPQQNAAFMLDNATQTTILRSSIKSNWTNAGIQAVDPSNVKIEGVYTEGFPLNGQPHANPDIQVGGYLPYTNLTQTLSGTNCATLAPCLVTVAQSVGWMNEANNTSQLASTNMSMDIVCPDYNPGSTAACASVSGVQQNQFERVLASFLPNGQIAITARNLSGSTAPANTSWPSGAHVGWVSGDYNNSPRKALDPGMVLVNNHMEDIDLPGGSQWYVYTSDQTPMIASVMPVGITPDDVMTFPPGTASFTAPTYQVKSTNSGLGACASVSLYAGCPVIEGGSYISIQESQLSVNAVGNELNPSSIPSLDASALLLTSPGARFVYYPSTGALSGGTVVIPDQHTTVYQGCGSLTATNCLSIDVHGVTAGTSAQTIFSPSNTLSGFIETSNQSCQYDAPAAGGTHSQIRWCMDGGPYYGASGNPAPAMEEDNWTGTVWNRCLYIPASGVISGSCLSGLAATGASNIFTAANSFTAATTFGGATDHLSIDAGGQLCATANGGTSCYFQTTAAGNASVTGNMAAAGFNTALGAQILYRCTGTTNNGLVTAGTAGQTACGGAGNTTAIGFTGN